MSAARSWVLALLLATASVPALAQDQDSDQISDATRAAMLAAEREKKATEIVPPQRGRVEKALYGYDNGAGTPFVIDGVLYRPAQDCSRGYGGTVVVNRVQRLDETTFAEEPVERVAVSASPYTDGTHTLAQREGLVAVDARRRVVDFDRSRRELLARLRRIRA